MQILNVKKEAPKLLRKWTWEGLGLHLGEVWDSLGRFWSLGGLQDRFWSLLDPFWKPPAMILEGLEGLWALSFA